VAEERSNRWRRFRVRRRVPEQELESRAQRELKEAAKDDRGPLDDGGLKPGCYGCLGSMIVLFVIMIASIVTTCVLPKDWSLIGR
jgi:hypothetical protein